MSRIQPLPRARRVAAAAFVACTGLAAAALPAAAACMSDADVSAMFDAYSSLRPAPNPPKMSLDDAACTRAKFNRMLEMSYRQAVGYKAGLTNPAVQRRFNATAPVWGVLYASMLLENGAVVDAAFGARPLFEADLLVRVKSEAINRAKTPAEVLDAIDEVIPFIELPDLMVQAPPQLDGAGVAAINVGARLGVAGTAIRVPVTRAERFQMLDGLRDMTVILRGDGAELDRGKGSDVLEHPLNAVVWLAQDLARQGLAMKPGELISLGSFSRLLPPKPGLKVEAEYVGLPGAGKVGVTFK